MILSYVSNLKLNRKTSLLFIVTFAGIVVFDSTIVNFSSYSGVELLPSVHFAIFVVFCMIFGLSSTFLLRSVRKIVSTYEYRPAHLGLRFFHGIISATQLLTIAISLIIILQMMFLDKYSLISLRVQAYVSHISAIIFLSFLVLLFAGWLKTKRSYVIVLYAISFSLACINLIISLIYLDSYFSISGLPDVTTYPITSYVINQPGLPFSESLSVVFDIVSLASFLLMWIATSIFLSQYKHKLGRLRYYALMGIPLVYYIFPLQGYFGDIFFSLLASSPVSYTIIYILIFSATKQVGAVLFGLAFLAASSLVFDNRIRKLLLISSIGMAILFGTFEISPLQYHVYPPYGLITQAFVPLGAYLLFIGIFTSAKHVARDASLRKEFYKNAASQLTLLRAIGVSQMEKELEDQVKLLQKKAELLSDRKYESELKEEEVKEILHDVLNELYYSKAKKEIQQS